jgi:PIN domain nuclease of toxin-antitoxin system
MKALFDTHCLLWWLSDPGQLNPRVRTLLAENENELYLSAISALEIAIKWQLGKLTLPEPPETFVSRVVREQSLIPLPVRQDHALAVASLPRKHGDPFDRVLVCQSLIEDFPIITADRAFRNYDVRLIWAGRRAAR